MTLSSAADVSHRPAPKKTTSVAASTTNSSNANTTVQASTFAAPPTTSHITSAETELAELIERKKQIERNLINLEVQIYNYETAYLEETQQYGNLLKGLEGYAGGRGERRRTPIMDGDRVFSRSSATFQKALSIHNRLLSDERSAAAASSSSPYARHPKASAGRHATSSKGSRAAASNNGQQPSVVKRPKTAAAARMVDGGDEADDNNEEDHGAFDL